MDCIFCCLLRAFFQIYPACYWTRLEGRSKTPCLSGMVSNVHLTQSMHRSSHVNRVQGEQKRIFGERHKWVRYFRVGIRCSQRTSLSILRKEELVGLLHPVKLWKSGSKMHFWGPSCFYNYQIEIVWNLLPEPKPTHIFSKIVLVDHMEGCWPLNLRQSRFSWVKRVKLWSG